MRLPPLPIDEALPALTAALAAGRFAVLVAPPGAGKTTRVPLALLEAGWRGDGRIVMLEPRRLAARAAARRMAETLGEAVADPRLTLRTDPVSDTHREELLVAARAGLDELAEELLFFGTR